MRRPQRPRPDAGANLLDGLRQLAEGLQGLAAQGERNIEIGGQQGRVSFGYTMRTADGTGQAGAPGAPSAPSTTREPIIEVIEQDDAILVIADMPGIAADQVTARIEDETLLLDAPPWHKRLRLPARVQSASPRVTARNGIIEIHMPRQPAA
jgi:HSP20 family molecular chaperone IbpA